MPLMEPNWIPQLDGETANAHHLQYPWAFVWPVKKVEPGNQTSPLSRNQLQVWRKLKGKLRWPEIEFQTFSTSLSHWGFQSPGVIWLGTVTAVSNHQVMENRHFRCWSLRFRASHRVISSTQLSIGHMNWFPVNWLANSCYPLVMQHSNATWPIDIPSGNLT